MKNLLLTLFFSCILFQGFAVNISSADSAVLESFWEYAEREGISKLSVSQRVPVIGRFFMDYPYQGGTLNKEVTELPTINLREFDCVIFVEVTLALSMLKEYNNQSIEDFVHNIVELRYRNGEIVDYTSRLHYSSDWLYEMDRRGLLEDVSRLCGGESYPNRVCYMTENTSKYHAIKNSGALKKKMQRIEAEINERDYYYVPQDKIRQSLHLIKTGDVVLITTNIKGLDTCHVGIAIELDGRIHFLHASEKEKRVVISEDTLDKYIQSNHHQTGIMLARINPVEGAFLHY